MDIGGRNIVLFLHYVIMKIIILCDICFLFWYSNNQLCFSIRVLVVVITLSLHVYLQIKTM